MTKSSTIRDLARSANRDILRTARAVSLQLRRVGIDSSNASLLISSYYSIYISHIRNNCDIFPHGLVHVKLDMHEALTTRIYNSRAQLSASGAVF